MVACNPSDPAKRIQQLEDALAKERERSSVARMIRTRRELTRIQCSACRTELRAPVHTTRVGDDIVAAWVQPPADWWVLVARHAPSRTWPKVPTRVPAFMSSENQTAQNSRISSGRSRG